MNKSKIELQKGFKLLLKKSEQLSKPEYCILCGHKMDSACNSHVVPKFILKEIAENGMLYYGQSINKQSDCIDPKTGIKDAFTFKLICRECDNSEFSIYESQQSIVLFEELPYERQKECLIEMAIKTHLSHIYSKANIYNLLALTHPKEFAFLRTIGKPTAYEIDIKEHQEYIDELLELRGNNDFGFEIIYNKLFDYKMDIATQTIIAYIYDLNDNILFDPNDFSTSIAKYFYLAIFPYKNKTRVLFFIEKKNMHYVDSIINDFLKMSEEERLKFIFISLMLYDEQFFINPKLHDIIMRDSKLKKLYRSTDGISRRHKAYMQLKNYKKYNNYLTNDLL